SVPALLLVPALFGVSALAGTEYAYVHDLFKTGEPAGSGQGLDGHAEQGAAQPVPGRCGQGPAGLGAGGVWCEPARWPVPAGGGRPSRGADGGPTGAGDGRWAGVWVSGAAGAGGGGAAGAGGGGAANAWGRGIGWVAGGQEQAGEAVEGGRVEVAGDDRGDGGVARDGVRRRAGQPAVFGGGLGGGPLGGRAVGAGHPQQLIEG